VFCQVTAACVSPGYKHLLLLLLPLLVPYLASHHFCEEQRHFFVCKEAAVLILCRQFSRRAFNHWFQSVKVAAVQE
jgi:hypothetical protein